MPKYSARTVDCENQKENTPITHSSKKRVSETTAFGLIGMFDRAFVSQQQWSSSHGSLEQRSSYQQ